MGQIGDGGGAQEEPFFIVVYNDLADFCGSLAAEKAGKIEALEKMKNADLGRVTGSFHALRSIWAGRGELESRQMSGDNSFGSLRGLQNNGEAQSYRQSMDEFSRYKQEKAEICETTVKKLKDLYSRVEALRGGAVEGPGDMMKLPGVVELEIDPRQSMAESDAFASQIFLKLALHHHGGGAQEVPRSRIGERVGIEASGAELEEMLADPNQNFEKLFPHPYFRSDRFSLTEFKDALFPVAMLYWIGGALELKERSEALDCFRAAGRLVAFLPGDCPEFSEIEGLLRTAMGGGSDGGNRLWITATGGKGGVNGFVVRALAGVLAGLGEINRTERMTRLGRLIRALLLFYCNYSLNRVLVGGQFDERFETRFGQFLDFAEKSGRSSWREAGRAEANARIFANYLVELYEARPIELRFPFGLNLCERLAVNFCKLSAREATSPASADLAVLRLASTALRGPTNLAESTLLAVFFKNLYFVHLELAVSQPRRPNEKLGQLLDALLDRIICQPSLAEPLNSAVVKKVSDRLAALGDSMKLVAGVEGPNVGLYLQSLRVADLLASSRPQQRINILRLAQRLGRNSGDLLLGKLVGEDSDTKDSVRLFLRQADDLSRNFLATFERFCADFCAPFARAVVEAGGPASPDGAEVEVRVAFVEGLFSGLRLLFEKMSRSSEDVIRSAPLVVASLRGFEVRARTLGLDLVTLKEPLKPLLARWNLVFFETIEPATRRLSTDFERQLDSGDFNRANESGEDFLRILLGFAEELGPIFDDPLFDEFNRPLSEKATQLVKKFIERHFVSKLSLRGTEKFFRFQRRGLEDALASQANSRAQQKQSADEIKRCVLLLQLLKKYERTFLASPFFGKLLFGLSGDNNFKDYLREKNTDLVRRMAFLYFEVEIKPLILGEVFEGADLLKLQTSHARKVIQKLETISSSVLDILLIDISAQIKNFTFFDVANLFLMKLSNSMFKHRAKLSDFQLVQKLGKEVDELVGFFVPENMSGENKEFNREVAKFKDICFSAKFNDSKSDEIIHFAYKLRFKGGHILNIQM